MEAVGKSWPTSQDTQLVVDDRAAVRRPRVAIVSCYFDLDSGYIESVLAGGLAETADTFVVTSNVPTPGLGRATSEGSGNWTREGNVAVKRLRPMAQIRTRVVTAGVRTALREISPDLIMQLSPSQVLPLPATAYARKTGTPIVYVSGEHSEQVPASGVRRWGSLVFRRVVLGQIQRYTSRRASLCLGATPETARDLALHAGRSVGIESIRLPFDQRIFRWSSSQRDSIRAERGWRGLVTLYSGKFDGRKNLPSLIDWWQHTFPDDPEARMVLVGDSGSGEGPESEVRKHAAEIDPNRISVLPFVRPDELNRIMNAADLAVFPNATVGIHQAMGTGMCVVVPDVPALSELEEPGFPEFVTKYQVDASLAWEKVSRAITGDPQLSSVIARRQELIMDPHRRQARAAVAQRHSVQALVDRLLRLIVPDEPM